MARWFSMRSFSMLFTMYGAVVLGLSVLIAAEPEGQGGGKPKPADPKAADKAADKAGEEPIDPARARQLFEKRQSGEKLTADEEAYLRRAIESRRQGGQGGASLEERLKTAGLDPEKAKKLHQRHQSGEKLDDEEMAYLKKAYDALGQAAPGANEKIEGRIDLQRVRDLMAKRAKGEKLTPEEEEYVKKAEQARARAGAQAGGPTRAIYGRDKSGFKPLNEMTADDRYLEQDGGLYGGGKNVPPQPHLKAALAARDKIEPLSREGKPDPAGKIVLVSISMSNATQEFSMFKQIADADPAKSPKLQIIDCAQGGQAMAEWVSPTAGPWATAEQRIAGSQASPQQVQIAWIKLANKGPRGDLEEHGRKLQRDTLAVIQNAKAKFPNLKLIYLGSRIYGGYTQGPLNPEPYAYESAFAARWLIQDQIAGKPELNYDLAKTEVRAPVLLWGPYCWGDGVTPRATDKLVWTREDFGGDGTHPSNAGREKVARMLLDFFKSDETAKSWFVK